MEMIDNRISLLGDKGCQFEPLLKIKDFPIRMGVTDNVAENDVFEDFSLIIDKKTGMVQLEKLVPPEILYEDTHYNNVASNWKDHHKAFANLIAEYKPRSVFEIGGGTGLLSKIYTDDNPDIKWVILEASPNPVDGCKAEYIKGMFDENYQIPEEYNAVIHTHTMEHFFKPLESIEAISRSIRVGGLMFFSIPNIEEMYRRLYTNVLNFEHTFFCLEPYVSVIMKKCGFKVVRRDLFKEDHSVFYVCEKASEKIVDEKMTYGNCYEKNRNLVLAWERYHRDLTKEINKVIDDADEERNIYLFGAHAFSQFLLSFGVNKSRLCAVLDNDGSKQGKRLYGTNLKVYSPQILANDTNPIVVLHAGTHDREIREGILQINNTAVFV